MERRLLEARVRSRSDHRPTVRGILVSGGAREGIPIAGNRNAARPGRNDIHLSTLPSGRGPLYEAGVLTSPSTSCTGAGAGPPTITTRPATPTRTASWLDEPRWLQLLSFRDSAESSDISPESVQVLIVLAARFARLSWKYSKIAYALTLKHVVSRLPGDVPGGLSAMDLAPCAIGSGDSDLFSRASGIDYCEETSVGEFLLGSRSPSDDVSR